MLGSFRIRMLVVIVIAALAGLSMQSEHSSKKIVEPVIRYVMKDYGVQENIVQYWSELKINKNAETVPVSNTTTLQQPCEFADIEREYGWHWNEESQQQEFFPAVLINVEDNSEVKPIYEGRVADISSDERGKTVLIDHGGSLYSSYGGLREVLAEKGHEVDKDTIIGRTSQELYFQMTSKDGPLNPNKLFEQ